jgi:hypothetical protein
MDNGGLWSGPDDHLEGLMSKSMQIFAAAMFKPIATGYVFCAPNPRLFGRARYLLANEAQKAAITQRLAGAGRWRLLLAFVLWIAAYAGAVGGMALLTGHDDPTAADVIILFVLAAASLLVCLQAWYVLSLKAVIAGLPETEEKFNFRERHAALRKAMLQRSWLVAGMIWSAACAMNLYAYVLKTHGVLRFSAEDGSFARLFLTILSGCLAVRFFYLEIRSAGSRSDEKAETTTESAIDAIGLRLDRLESDNKRLRRTLAGVVALGSAMTVGAVLLFGSMPRVADAQKMILRGSKGDVVALLGTNNNDRPSLGLYDSEHKARMVFGVTDAGSPTLGFYDSENRLRMLFGLGDTGAPSVGLYGADGKLRKSVAIDDWGKQQVDQVLDHWKSPAPARTEVENYFSAPAPKAWAASAASRSRTMVTAAPTIEEAKRRALDACGKQPNANDCAVVMINNDWVAAPATDAKPR